MGKSSITTQLALSLSLAGHTVGVLDVDLTGPSLPRLLGLEDAKITQAPGGWLPVKVHPSQTLPPAPEVSSPETNGASHNGSGISGPQLTNGNTSAASVTRPIGALHAISLGFLLPSRSSAVVWRGPKKTAMVRQFLTDVLWPPLDYLLIDTPPGTSDEHISLAETLLQQTSAQSKLAGAVIVTTPQAVAVSDVRKELSFCMKVGIGVLGVVENMSGYLCECCGEETNLFGKGGGEVMAQEFGARFLGRVPVDPQWGLLVEDGVRPRYGIEAAKDDEDEDQEEKEEEEETVDGEHTRTHTRTKEDFNGADNLGSNGTKEARDGALLVDKYRSCLLAPVFEGIARQLVDIVQNAARNGT